MWTIKFILVVICVHLVRNDEIADTTVEFSSHKSTKPVENAKNASTLITQEIETRLSQAEFANHVAEIKDRDICEGSSQNMSLFHFFLNLRHCLEDLLIQERQVNLNCESKAANESSNATTEAKTKIKVECAPKVIPENEIPKVQVTNSTVLLKYLTPPVANNASTNECIVVLFYSPQCIFSARMAPHYNALARVYTDITFYAVDAMDYGNLHVRYGLVYVPNVMLFHNAKPIARFNETTMNLDQFVKFINKFTGLEHNETSLNVTSADMSGPVPSTLTKKVDFVLILAWVFTIFCLCFGFAKSSICRRLVDLVKNTWQEAAAAQHEHEE